MTLELSENINLVLHFMKAFRAKHSKPLALYITSEITPKTLVLDSEHRILADLDYEDEERATQKIDLAIVSDYISKKYDLDAIAELFH